MEITASSGDYYWHTDLLTTLHCQEVVLSSWTTCPGRWGHVLVRNVGNYLLISTT